MARLVTAASFVQSKMPLGAGGSLSAHDAFDIAAYFTREPRPDFPNKAGDWSKGGKPADARN
jgi:thiosulfate dehydrogenase